MIQRNRNGAGARLDLKLFLFLFTADGGIELDFRRRVARLHLSEGLVDNVPMGRPLDAELQ